MFRPPIVRVTAPACDEVTEPAPASEPSVWLEPYMSSTAPAATVTALLALIALVVARRSVPTLTVVAPV